MTGRGDSADSADSAATLDAVATPEEWHLIGV